MKKVLIFAVSLCLLVFACACTSKTVVNEQNSNASSGTEQSSSEATDGNDISGKYVDANHSDLSFEIKQTTESSGEIIYYTNSDEAYRAIYMLEDNEITFEHADTMSGENVSEKYILSDGKMLWENNSFNGTVPSGEKFDAELKYNYGEINSTYSFKSDGTFTDGTDSGTYTRKDSELVTKLSDGTEEKYYINDGTLYSSYLVKK